MDNPPPAPLDSTETGRRLIEFYKIHNPQKLEDTISINEILHRYKGRETKLFSDLHKKYEVKQDNSTLPPHTKMKPKVSMHDIFGERVIKLTIGFVRKYAQYDIPRDIYSLCIDYVGENFNAGKWKTNREILINNYYQQIDCTDVFDPDDVARNLCCFEECGWLGGLCWYFIGIALFIGKDIAGLVIVDNNSCDKAINGESKYVSFEVNNWIMIGCIAHLVYSGIYFGPCLCCWTDFEHYNRINKSILLIPLVCCFACFFIPWMVIGFVLYSEMIGHEGSVDSDCKNVVLSWCIIQVFESVIAPFFYCLCQSYGTFHDD